MEELHFLMVPRRSSTFLQAPPEGFSSKSENPQPPDAPPRSPRFLHQFLFCFFQGNNGFNRACEYGRFENVKYLFENGESEIECENKEGKNGLMLAVENGHLEMVQYLVGEKNGS